MGIRGVQLRRRIGQVHGRSQKSFRLRKRVPYGRKSEGLYLPPVREALNRACSRHCRFPRSFSGQMTRREICPKRSRPPASTRFFRCITTKPLKGLSGLEREIDERLRPLTSRVAVNG